MDALVATNKEHKKEIALIDVMKSPSVASIDSKDHMLKRPVLVLNVDQLKGNPSSRALLVKIYSVTIPYRTSFDRRMTRRE